MSIPSFNIKLNNHFVLKYYNKTRIVIPSKILTDGFMAYENNKIKRFKFEKMECPSEDEVNEVIFNYDFDNNINRFPETSISSNTSSVSPAPASPLNYNPWQMRSAQMSDDTETDEDPRYTTPTKKRSYSIPNAPKKSKLRY